MPDLDSYLVRHALTVARENGYAEVELTSEAASFTAVLEPKPAPAKKAVAAKNDTVTEPEFLYVKSSLVGYLQSVAVAEGDQVEKGKRFAVVAALGLANDVDSNVTGEVVELLVKPGDPVEYGQRLAKVMPS